jgi:hypothetical protein
MRNRRPFDDAVHPRGSALFAAVEKSGVPYCSWFLENPLRAGSSFSIEYFQKRRNSKKYFIFCFA